MFYYNSHFTDEETRAQEASGFFFKIIQLRIRQIDVTEKFTEPRTS